jgi:hypothetical protein
VAMRPFDYGVLGDTDISRLHMTTATSLHRQKSWGLSSS